MPATHHKPPWPVRLLPFGNDPPIDARLCPFGSMADACQVVRYGVQRAGGMAGTDLYVG